MYHQLSQSELASIYRSIRDAEVDCIWFINLVKSRESRVKSSEEQNQKSEKPVVAGEQCLSA